MDGEHGERAVYVAYMLRLWQAGTRGGLPLWHASLEDPHTGERLAFGDTDDLFAFLEQAMTGLSDERDQLDESEPTNC